MAVSIGYSKLEPVKGVKLMCFRAMKWPTSNNLTRKKQN